MKSILALPALVSTVAVQAASLAFWDFNADTLTPSTGTGTLAPIGGVASFFGFGSGPSDPNIPPDRNWGFSNLPDQGADSGTAGFEGAVSTAGYQSIQLSFDIKAQFSASKYYEVLYSVDSGGTWSSAGTFGVASEDVWQTETFDLSSLNPAVNDNAGFQFQVVAVFKPGTSDYAGFSDTAASYGKFGPVTDAVQVSGLLIPEPESWALLSLCAIGGIGYRLRRRLQA
ncbi:MAG: hypothetical protein KIT22_17055 [Verrucomicrobiae bacterium]|nr:hypothetical protein [Verrucomicrobiae bacterium]